MIKKLLSICIIGFVLVGCGAKVHHRGQILNEQQQAQLPKLKTKSDVLESLGTPGAMNFDKTKWLYLGKRTEQTAFLTPDEEDYQLITFSFSGDKVRDMNIYGEASRNDISFSRKTTPVPGEIELNAFEELFMNIGRFNPMGGGDNSGPYN